MGAPLRLRRVRGGGALSGGLSYPQDPSRQEATAPLTHHFLALSMHTNTLEPPVLSLAERPDNEAFNQMDRYVDRLARAYRRGDLSPEDLETIRRADSAFLLNTVQGHGLRKPFGYAGDFMMIDMIYTQQTSKEPAYRGWDEYFHQQAAPRAVRNRKAYFKEWVARSVRTRGATRLLNVASGPGRDLAEAYAALRRPTQLQTTCVELDPRAIAYAEVLLHRYRHFVDFVEKNALRFQTSERYDLIWSAGLFDYFDDRTFVRLLGRFRSWLPPGGEAVVGNFNADHNPSRDYMELLGDWHLNHRTEAQLISLGERAGFERRQLHVGREPENVNLFLHAKVRR